MAKMETTRDDLDFSFEALARESELYERPLTQKQQDIVRAAEELFVENGFKETPTAVIAKRAGVTERTLFKHFKTKTELLRRIIFPILAKTLLPVQVKHVQTLFRKDHETYEEFLRDFVEDRHAFAKKQGGVFRIVIDELLFNPKLRSAVVKMWVKNIWPHFVSKVKDFQKRKELRADIPAETIARTQIMCIASYLMMRYVIMPELEWKKEKELEDLVQILLRGISEK